MTLALGRAIPSEYSRLLVLLECRPVDGGHVDVWRVHPFGEVRQSLSSDPPAMATSPRMVRNSSIWVMFRAFVHRLDGQARTEVLQIRKLRGPPLASSSRMSRRKLSLSWSQVRWRSYGGHSEAPAR